MVAFARNSPQLLLEQKLSEFCMPSLFPYLPETRHKMLVSPRSELEVNMMEDVGILRKNLDLARLI